VIRAAQLPAVAGHDGLAPVFEPAVLGRMGGADTVSMASASASGVPAEVA